MTKRLFALNCRLRDTIYYDADAAVQVGGCFIDPEERERKFGQFGVCRRNDVLSSLRTSIVMYSAPWSLFI